MTVQQVLQGFNQLRAVFIEIIKNIDEPFLGQPFGKKSDFSFQDLFKQFFMFAPACLPCLLFNPFNNFS